MYLDVLCSVHVVSNRNIDKTVSVSSLFYIYICFIKKYVFIFLLKFFLEICIFSRELYISSRKISRYVYSLEKIVYYLEKLYIISRTDYVAREILYITSRTDYIHLHYMNFINYHLCSTQKHLQSNKHQTNNKIYLMGSKPIKTINIQQINIKS